VPKHLPIIVRHSPKANALKAVPEVVGPHEAFSASDGTAGREAWRLALFGLLSPLGRIVAREIQNKLDERLNLKWDELRASDLAGRARAFQSMVSGGMDVARAASLAGLMTED
jgi:hypothetical protein